MEDQKEEDQKEEERLEPPQGWRRQAAVLNSRSVGGGWLRVGPAANCREVTPSARGSANQSDNPNKQRKWCEAEGRLRILFIRCYALRAAVTAAAKSATLPLFSAWSF